MKDVKRILFGNMVDMGGIPLRQPIPTQQVDQIDPFLLLHHARWKIKAGSNAKSTGVDPHPHRGFSPVTFVFEGSIHHRDSRGNSGIVQAGGVQWMNAGMGIIHSERPSEALASSGGYQEIIQLWVNTPSNNKMDQPYYLALQREDMPFFAPDEGKGRIQVVSGEINGTSGMVKTLRPLLSVMAWLEEAATHTFQVPERGNTLLYLLDGALKLGGHGLLEKHNLVEFESLGTELRVTASEAVRFLLLWSDPLEEPVAWQGPFVMNNETQILEAMRDYQMGKMGMLIEDFD